MFFCIALIHLWAVSLAISLWTSVGVKVTVVTIRVTLTFRIVSSFSCRKVIPPAAAAKRPCSWVTQRDRLHGCETDAGGLRGVVTARRLRVLSVLQTLLLEGWRWAAGPDQVNTRLTTNEEDVFHFRGRESQGFLGIVFPKLYCNLLVFIRGDQMYYQRYTYLTDQFVLK